MEGQAERASLVTHFWELFHRGDFMAAGQLLHEEAEVYWVNSKEAFRGPGGRDRFIEANAKYPGCWHIRLEKLCHSGDQVITVVAVSSPDEAGEFRAVSFFTFRDGLIQKIEEYWGDVAEPPAWRVEMGLAERC